VSFLARHYAGKIRMFVGISFGALCLMMPAVNPPLAAQNDTSAPPTPEMPAIIATAFSTPLDKVWQEILKEAAIPYEIIDVQEGRRRRMFVDGEITLECCFAPEWRNRKDEQLTQLFSDALHISEVRYVFKKGETIPIPSPTHLKDLRFAVVRDFSYIFEPYFGETIVANSPADAMRLVEVGRAHLTEAAKVLFNFEMAKNPRNLELGDIVDYKPIRVRVHVSRADLLPRLNAAIASLKKSGRIRQLLYEFSRQ